MPVQSKPIKSIDFDEMLFITIEGFPYYEVNKNGDVKNIKTNKILKPTLNTKGYYVVNLYENGIRKTKTIHKLVAESFLSNPDNLPDVNHINNDRTDNRIENLEFASINANNRNKLKHSNVNYTFINEVPSNSLHITFIKNNDITDVGLFFNKQTEEFYIKMTDNKYRIMYKNPHRKSYFIQYRFNGKVITYSPNQMKRDYNEYFIN